MAQACSNGSGRVAQHTSPSAPPSLLPGKHKLFKFCYPSTHPGHNSHQVGYDVVLQAIKNVTERIVVINLQGAQPQ